MKFAMTKMTAAVLMAGFSVAASAAGGTGTVTEVQITGGSFAMGAPGVGACGSGGPFGNFQCITGGPLLDTDDGLFEAGNLLGLTFFGQPVNTSTALTAAGAAPSTSGNPLSGTATTNTITLDLGSFYANWSGSNFLQAPSHENPNGSNTGVIDSPLVTGTYDSTTGAFSIAWGSYITTAPFADQTGYWILNGTAAAVPEASTYGMMLAGLGLVGGMVARRRKLVA